MTPQEKNTVRKAMLESIANGCELRLQIDHEVMIGEYFIQAYRTETDYPFLVRNSTSIPYAAMISEIKPIYRPLSQLTEPITVDGYNDGKEFVPMDRISLKDVDILNAYLNNAYFFQDAAIFNLTFRSVSNLISWGFWIYDQSYFEKGIVIEKTT